MPLKPERPCEQRRILRLLAEILRWKAQRKPPVEAADAVIEWDIGQMILLVLPACRGQLNGPKCDERLDHGPEGR